MKEIGELITLDTKSVDNPSAATSAAEHCPIGKLSFEEFLKCLEDGQNCKIH
jgi:hypothetical protein